jgi:hypothetical protein
MGELLLGVPLLCGESERDQLDKVGDLVSMSACGQSVFFLHGLRLIGCESIKDRDEDNCSALFCSNVLYFVLVPVT